MKVALAVWDGRVSPVFDVSREAVIATIENGAVRARVTERIDAPTPDLRVGRLVALGVETVICGAVSEALRRELQAQGIRVLGFVAGEIQEVLESFLAGALPAPVFAMPGCGGGHGFGRGRRGRGQCRRTRGGGARR